jgi:signal transduction histidine kinase
MTRLFSACPALATRTSALEAAATFVLEVLSPFEATHRGFQETHRKVLDLNRMLAQRNLQLDASNRSLQSEVLERKRTEKALRESERFYRALFSEARQMQEDLRQLSNQILHVQEEERTRISRELHDEIGQALVAIQMNLAIACKQKAGLESESSDKIGAARQLLEETMETVHRFARELRPRMLEHLGLIPTLRSYVKTFGERISVATRFRASRTAEKLGEDQKIALYRVLQESLTNVAKHARATKVLVTLRKVRNRICMEIQDNGRAFAVDKQIGVDGKKQLGLLGMRERMRLIHGNFLVVSKRGKGTSIRVQVPLH